jgi:hypothetical protein
MGSGGSCPICYQKFQSGIIVCSKCASKVNLNEPSTNIQQLKAEIAALLLEFDATGSQRYSTISFDTLINKLRQLSAV